MAEAAASWFVSPPAETRGRLLDPCAGEGEIASLPGRLLNYETWGCELFPYRAEKAATPILLCSADARPSGDLLKPAPPCIANAPVRLGLLFNTVHRHCPA
jgi:hypothetical protein